MEVRYSAHLRLRLKVRDIPEDLPRVVYFNARRRFIDLATQTEVAIARRNLWGKQRDIVLIYRRYATHVVLITMHPLKPGQAENRVQTGRWQKIQDT